MSIEAFYLIKLSISRWALLRHASDCSSDSLGYPRPRFVYLLINTKQSFGSQNTPMRAQRFMPMQM